MIPSKQNVIHPYKQRAKYYTANSLIFLISLGVVLLICEGLIRTFFPQELGAIVNIYETDDILKYKYKPNSRTQQSTREFNVEFATNSAGFRDKEYGIKKGRHTKRVLVFGDSFSVGHGVKINSVYSEVLENLLNRKNSNSGQPQWEVINAAVGGYHTEQYLSSFEKHIKEYEPNLAIVGFFIGNDFGGFDTDAEMMIDKGYLLGYRKGHLSQQSHKGSPLGKRIRARIKPLREWLALHSQLYILTRNLLYPLLYRYDLVDARYGWRLDLFKKRPSDETRNQYFNTEQYIKRFKSVATSYGIPLLVLIIPERYQVDDELWEKSKLMCNCTDEEVGQIVPNNWLIKILDKHGLEYIDLLPLFKNNPDAQYYFHHDGHWNEAGHKFAAIKLHEKIRNKAL